MKEYIMTNPEMFRNNSFNRCRYCGQYLDKDEKYYFKCMNGDKLQDTLGHLCTYKIENFYIHSECFNKHYRNYTVEEFIIDLFNNKYPAAKNKLTGKQLENIETIKENCKKNNYYFREKTKYIHISGIHKLKNSQISIRGKYNKITMKMEADEKGFNLKYMAQKVYLDDLMRMEGI